MIQPKYLKFFGDFEILENKGFEIGDKTLIFFLKSLESLWYNGF